MRVIFVNDLPTAGRAPFQNSSHVGSVLNLINFDMSSNLRLASIQFH